MSQGLYYQPVERVGVLGWVVTPLVGLVAACILSPLYVFACESTGLVYIYFVAPPIFAGALGWCVAIAARLCRVRWDPLPISVAIISGVLSLYLIWVFTIAAKFDLNDLIFSLGGIFSRMGVLISQDYTIHKIGWQAARWSYPGWVRPIMWFLEAVVIVGGPLVGVALHTKTEAVYCNECGDSCLSKDYKAYPIIPPDERAEFVGRLERGDLSQLDAMQRIDPKTRQRTEMTLTYCPNCNKTQLLTVTAIDQDFGGPSRVNTSARKEDVVTNLYVPAKVYKMLRAKRRPKGDK